MGDFQKEMEELNAALEKVGAALAQEATRWVDFLARHIWIVPLCWVSTLVVLVVFG